MHPVNETKGKFGCWLHSWGWDRSIEVEKSAPFPFLQERTTFGTKAHLNKSFNTEGEGNGNHCESSSEGRGRTAGTLDEQLVGAAVADADAARRRGLGAGGVLRQQEGVQLLGGSAPGLSRS